MTDQHHLAGTSLLLGPASYDRVVDATRVTGFRPADPHQMSLFDIPRRPRRRVVSLTDRRVGAAINAARSQPIEPTWPVIA